jgi:transcriptional regulator with XRE-family HTH domain
MNTSKNILPRKRLFAKLHRRLRSLDFTYTEFAELFGLSVASFSQRMNGKIPFTEPEMQRCADLLCQPEKTLADLFERRAV